MSDNRDESVHGEHDEHRLAAILAGDVAGYTRLVAEDEAHTRKTLRAYQDEIRRQVAAHRGELVDFAAGDGLLATFPSSVYAVRCALEIQEALHVRNEALSAERRVVFRLGAHVGDVTVDEGGLTGSGVNIAARLEPLAEPGGLCVSERVREDLRGRLDLEFRDLGPQDLKNLPEPVRAFAIAASGGAPEFEEPRARRGRVRARAVAAVLAALALLGGLWLLARQGPTHTAGAPPAPPVVAVLPFADMSEAGDQQYFGDGLAEEVLNALTRVEGLGVVARTSAFAFRDRERDVRAIAEELDATAILEGSVRKSPAELRVTVQLIDSASGLHLWSEIYDVDPQEIFAVQERIAGEVVAALRSRLAVPLGAHDSSTRGPISPEIYDLYLEALYTASDNDIVGAAHRLQRVIREAPEFSPARALLAQSYMTMGGTGLYHLQPLGLESRAQATELARIEALEALRLDPALSAGHAALGRVRMQGDWDWEGAETSYARAMELGPSVREMLQYADLLRATGRADAAVEVAARAIDLDPVNRVSAWAYGRALAHAGRLEHAIDYYERSHSLGVMYNDEREDVIEAYWALEQLDEAVQEAQELVRFQTQTVGSGEQRDSRAIITDLAEQFAAEGFAETWRTLAEWYLASGWMTRCCNSQAARFYAQIGDRERAIELLRRGLAEREWGMQWILSPSFAPLRNEPAYREIVAEVGLTVPD